MTYAIPTTPYCVIDLDVSERNASLLLSFACSHGLTVRPHLKTHKTHTLALLQAPVSHSSVTGVIVSTIAEAEHFLAVDGLSNDLTLATPVTRHKINRIVKVAERARGFSVIVDTMDGVAELLHGLEASPMPAGMRLGVWVKVDTGYGRLGLLPRETVDVARAVVADDRLMFVGVYSHAGHSYAARSAEELAGFLEDEARGITEAKVQLEAAGVPCPVVAIGSTPTVLGGAQILRGSRDAPLNLHGVTEVHPGNYICMDRHQATIGSGCLSDVAVRVVARVISVHPERNGGEFVIDAGTLALSKDPGPAHMATGYGLIVGRPDLELLRMTQEVCVVSRKKAADGVDPLPLPRLGDLVEIIPNHSCITIACFPTVHFARQGMILHSEKPCKGW